MFFLPPELRSRIWAQDRYLHAKVVLHGHLIQRASRQQVKQFGLPDCRTSSLLVMLPCRTNPKKVLRFNLSLDVKAWTYSMTCDMTRVKVHIQHTPWGTITSIYDRRIVEFWDSHPGLPLRRS